jgi:cytochrome c
MRKVGLALIYSCRWLRLVSLASFLVLPAVALCQQSGSPSAQGKARAPHATQATSFSAQAQRGKKRYQENCMMCHKDDLAGLDPAPPLTGDSFMRKWQGKSLWDMFDKIRKTMPQDNRGGLNPRVYLDIVAYMAKFNDIDVGKQELRNDPKKLKSLIIRKPDPSHPSS